jgi:hypothetical protein
MLEQLVEQKEQWIGGVLEDFGVIFPTKKPAKTTITGITLNMQRSGNSMYFEIVGEDFGCGFDTSFGGITAGENGWLTFHGYDCHIFRIKKKS